MPNLRKSGRYWSLERSNTWTFFGSSGRVVRGRWKVDPKNFSEDPLWKDSMQDVPFHSLDETEYLPNAVVKLLGTIPDSKKPQIAYIGITPFQALLLTLEGVIDLEILNKSVERAYTIQAVIKVKNTEYKIHISPDFTACRAYTSKGLEVK